MENVRATAGGVALATERIVLRRETVKVATGSSRWVDCGMKGLVIGEGATRQIFRPNRSAPPSKRVGILAADPSTA
jgi:hypothetical protein